MEKKVEIAKPVASRPCSNFRSFPDALERAVSSPPPSPVAQKLIAIKPKTVRLTTTSFDSSDRVVSITDDVSESIPSRSPEKEHIVSDPKLILLYKPTAKAVSRATVSLLANLGNFDGAIHQQQEGAAGSIRRSVHAAEQAKASFDYRAAAAHPQSSSSQFDRIMNLPTSVPPISEAADARSQQAAGHDRPSYDGYNWRKYGQKQVKGSEYPRSYYKCTYPTCPVKKKVERSFDGQIAEIVYKGEHNHPKPQPPRRLSSAALEQGFVVADEHGREAGNNPSWTSSLPEMNASSGGIETLKETSLRNASSYGGQVQFPRDPLADAVYDCNASSADAAAVQVLRNPSRAVVGDHDQPDLKRRRCEDQVSGTNSVGEASTDPQSMMHTAVETDVSGDGYHWRKYGQKVVKGNTYPRSYYKCTSPKCSVRKYVERASDESGYFVTTYEGKHNHEMPLRKNNFVASNSDAVAAAALDSGYDI